MLLGTVTLVSVEFVKNAFVPMLFTGRLLVELGIVTAASEPVYPVIVTVPFVVEILNWAEAARGQRSSPPAIAAVNFTAPSSGKPKRTKPSL